MERVIHTKNKARLRYLRLPVIVLISMALASSSLLDKVSPFAAAFVASLSGIDCASAFLGAVLGFWAGGTLVDTIPNLVALLVIAVFRIILVRERNDWLNTASSVLCGVAVLAANVLLATKTSDVLISVTFGISAGVISYAFIRCQRLIFTDRRFSMMKPMNVAAIAISYVALIAAASSYTINVVHIGLLLGVLATLSIAERFKYSGGAIVASLSALGVVLSDFSFAAAALVLITAGMGSALFTRLGKVTQAAGFIFIVGIGAVIFGINTYTLTLAVAAFGGGILFMLLPTSRLVSKIKEVPKPRAGADIAEVFSERLIISSNAMNEIRTAVEKTAEILDRRNNKEISWVYNSACGAVCQKCRFSTICWGTEYDETVKSMSRLMIRLRKGFALLPSDISGELQNRCIKKEQLISTINIQYKEYLSTNAANRRVAEMRTILAAQLSATEQMIKQMAEEFSDIGLYDRSSGAIVEAIIAEYGVEDVKAAVELNHGRSTVEAYGKGRLRASEEELCQKISSSLKIEFDLPEIEQTENGFRVTMYERALYSVEYGVAQVSRANEKSCGDYYDTFIDSKGYAYVILSDGMGSGSRARIDSAFACGMLVKLLRSGVNLVSAIDLINNSLLVKSSDESFATLDVCRIDLYSGNVELYKAGGAPTYIRCNKKIIKANGTGMPIGIEHKTNLDKQSFSIGDRDIIIMTSDGVEINETWLHHELEAVDGKSDDMENIANVIAEASRFAAGKEKGDDISVIAVKLVK